MARGKPTSRSAARKRAKQDESDSFRLIGPGGATVPTKRGEDDRLLVRNRRINLENWRADREARFIFKQQRTCQWIPFREIAEWYAERSGRFDAAELDRAYDMLLRDLLVGDFEEGGRSRVRYLHPATSKARMTREWMQRMIDTYREEPEKVRLHYLSRCWLPQHLFQKWLKKHELPPSPVRFKPHEGAFASDEERAIKALAAHLKQMPDCRRNDAAEWCRQQAFTLSNRRFQSQIWPKARALANLAEKGPPGRKRKPK
jgi:hypothetical protein